MAEPSNIIPFPLRQPQIAAAAIEAGSAGRPRRRRLFSSRQFRGRVRRVDKLEHVLLDQQR